MGQSRGSFALVVALNLFDPAFGRQKRVEALTGQDGSDVSPSGELLYMRSLTLSF